MFAGALLLATCSGGDGGQPPYPEPVVERFVSACETVGANRAYCSCLIDGIQDAVPLEEFQRLESAILYGGAIDAAMRGRLGEITVDCIARHG